MDFNYWLDISSSCHRSHWEDFLRYNQIPLWNRNSWWWSHWWFSWSWLHSAKVLWCWSRCSKWEIMRFRNIGSIELWNNITRRFYQEISIHDSKLNHTATLFLALKCRLMCLIMYCNEIWWYSLYWWRDQWCWWPELWSKLHRFCRASIWQRMWCQRSTSWNSC